MAKDIYILGEIYQYSTMWFYDQITEALKDNPDEELTVRINCDGGSPDYGMSIIQKLQELDEQITSLKVVNAHSMGLFALAYLPLEKCEALDTTMGVLHRAAWPRYFEESDGFKGSIYADILSKTNKDLEKAFRARVDVAALEALPQMKDKNLTLKDIFSIESRLEVMLTGADMKKIGLVGKVVTITPKKSAELKSMYDAFNTCKTVEDFKIAAKKLPAAELETPNPKTDTSKFKNMTLAQLKAEHPALYAEIMALGHAEGVATEKDRVEACLVYNEIDPKGVKAAIESGKPMTQKQMAEFSLKTLNASTLEALKANSAKPLETPAPAGTPKTEAEAKVEQFEALVDGKKPVEAKKVEEAPAAK